MDVICKDLVQLNEIKKSLPGQWMDIMMHHCSGDMIVVEIEEVYPEDYDQEMCMLEIFFENPDDIQGFLDFTYQFEGSANVIPMFGDHL